MKDPRTIILEPVITEKSTLASQEQNKYTFKVPLSANKIEIKKAVEELFNVKVLKVHTIRMRGKSRRLRFARGKTPDWKKAIVTLAPGHKIEFA